MGVLLAATVPGAFASWMTLLREQGSWSLADVLAPAIGYTTDGFPVSRRLSEAILGVRPLFLAEWTSSARQWLEGGGVPLPGVLIRIPGLAATYRRVIEEAQGAGNDRVAVIDAAIRIWQEGFVARKRSTASAAKSLRTTAAASASAACSASTTWPPGRPQIAKCVALTG